MCLAFIAKYVLFIGNLIFAFLGIAIVALGISVLVSLKDLEQIIPINLIPISLIVLGVVVCLIGCLACCGAIRESRCMLICYAIIVSILIAIFIYISWFVFSHLNTLESTVDSWLVNAFNSEDLRPGFHAMEYAFHCCGTTGPSSYTISNLPLPPTCCPNPREACTIDIAFDGCALMVSSWFETMGSALAVVLFSIIIVQSIAVIFSLYFTYHIGRKRSRKNY